MEVIKATSFGQYLNRVQILPRFWNFFAHKFHFWNIDNVRYRRNIIYNTNRGFCKFVTFLCGRSYCVRYKRPMSDAHCKHTTRETSDAYFVYNFSRYFKLNEFRCFLNMKQRLYAYSVYVRKSEVITQVFAQRLWTSAKGVHY
jgi:hypothetical protein